MGGLENYRLRSAVESNSWKMEELEIFVREGLYERNVDDEAVLDYWNRERVRSFSDRFCRAMAGYSGFFGIVGFVQSMIGLPINGVFRKGLDIGVSSGLSLIALGGIVSLYIRCVHGAFSPLDAGTYSQMRKAVKKYRKKDSSNN